MVEAGGRSCPAVTFYSSIGTLSGQELIREDLEQVKGKDVDKDAKVKLVGKDEMKENLGRSPDYGDCLMMRLYFELEPEGPWVGVLVA